MIAPAVLAELVVELALYAAAAAWLAQAHAVPFPVSLLLALSMFVGLRAALLATLYVKAAVPGWTRLIAAELVALVDVYIWGQLAQRWLAPRDPARVVPGVVPVLLVHGVLCNAGVWHRMLAALGRDGVVNVFTLNLAPPLGSIEDFARQIGARVDEVCGAAGTARAIVVAHSMGGLAARCWIARLGGAQRVARLITLGTPHHGSLLARGFPARWAGELACGCDWLEQLAADGARAAAVPTTSIWSRHDEFVAPQQSCCLQGAHNIALERVGHLELFRSREAHELVAREIAQARGERPS